MDATVTVKKTKKLKGHSGAVESKTVQIILFVLLLVGGIAMLYPVFYALLGSFATNEEFYETIFIPIPKTLAFLENYATLFSDPAVFTSMGVTFGKIILQLVITVFTSVLGGYVFAKLRFPFKRGFFLILISSMMIPGVALMVPNYVWMADFPLVGGNDITGQGGSGFLNNPWMHVVTGWLNVYNIFLCRQALVSIGGEMGESAKIDGAGFFRIVFAIYMPLIKPIVAVMFLNLFLGIWNDYLGSFIYFADAEQWQTVGYAVVRIMDIYSDPFRAGGSQYPVVFAISLMSMIPPIIVYICIQKQFTEGLAMGAVKG